MELIENQDIRVLSVRQPWASLIIEGGKDIENRTRQTSYEGHVWVHAGLQIDKIAMNKYFPHANIEAEFKLGGIIGSVDIMGCTDLSFSKWFEGPYGYLLENPQACSFKPLKGKLGFFRLPDYVCENCLDVLVESEYDDYCPGCGYRNVVR